MVGLRDLTHLRSRSAPPGSRRHERRLSALRRGEGYGNGVLAQRELKLDALKQLSPLGAYLDEAELRQVAKACSISKIVPGKILPESPFYLILGGQIAVLAGDGSGEELCTRSEGTFFTRHAGMGVDAHVQPATQMIGREHGQVMLLTYSGQYVLDEAYETWPSDVQDGYDAIVSTNMATLLSSVAFVKEAKMDALQLRHLGELCSYLALGAEEKVFSQGDPADCFYIVLKGGAEVRIDEVALTGKRRVSVVAPTMPTRRPTASGGGGASGGKGGDEQITKGYGEVFGVAAFVFGSREREYGMVTTERSLFLVINKASYQNFLKTSPMLEASLLFSVKRFVLQRMWLLHGSIFHSFTEEELEFAAKHTSFLKVNAREVVYAKGDKPKAFYAIAHGEVEFDYGPMEAGAPAPLNAPKGASLRVGEYFGEVGVLLPITQNLSTIRAKVDSTLLTISKQDFMSIVSGSTNVASQKIALRGSMGMLPPSVVAASAGEQSHFGVGKSGRHKSKKEERSLKRTLELELLIKLQRAGAPLDVLLLYPKAHRAFVGYLAIELYGGLRVDVFNMCTLMLRRVEAAVEQAPSLMEITISDVEEFLAEQARALVKLLRQRPCPNPNLIPQLSWSSKAAIKAAIQRLCEIEQAVVTFFDEDRHNGLLQPTDMQSILTQLFDANRALIEAGHTVFKTSPGMMVLLQKMGAYPEDFVTRIDSSTLEEIANDLILASKSQPQLLHAPKAENAKGENAKAEDAPARRVSLAAQTAKAPENNRPLPPQPASGVLGLPGPVVASRPPIPTMAPIPQHPSAIPGDVPVSSALQTLVRAVKETPPQLSRAEYRVLMTISDEAKAKYGPVDEQARPPGQASSPAPSQRSLPPSQREPAAAGPPAAAVGKGPRHSSSSISLRTPIKTATDSERSDDGLLTQLSNRIADMMSPQGRPPAAASQGQALSQISPVRV